MGVLFFLGFILLIIVGLAWAGYPWSINGQKNNAPILEINPAVWNDPNEEVGVIKILTWNIGYLYGKGSEGPGYEHRDKSIYDEKLKQLVKEIRKWNPDIICLQEIDFDSHRSGGINQARTLADQAGYPYVAEAISWKANYIPFPYWPLSRHFGHMKSGGAILSKYPLSSHEVVLLPKPASHPWWYNIFYLHRYLQKVEFQVGEKKFSLINLHLEAFDKLDRQSQIRSLVEKVKNEKIDFVAGDFNMVPTSAAKKKRFPDSDDDYENDQSFELMKQSEMSEAIPEEIYSLDESRYFTFPSWKPDRRLDYIFYQPQHKMMRAEVLNSQLSDHLPLKASFQIGAPKFDIYSQ